MGNICSDNKINIWSELFDKLSEFLVISGLIMQMYGNLCKLKRFGVSDTDLFEFYGLENMGIDTKKYFLG